MPQDIVEAFVMMRVAELVQEGVIGAAIDRALEQSGNVGSLALVEHADAIGNALIEIHAGPKVDARIWLAYT